MESKRPQLPFIILVGAVVFLLLCITVGIPWYFASAKQKSILFAELLNSKISTLDYFASSAKIPILADDTLRLNMVVKEATAVDGILYAFIVDRKQIIRAHSGQEAPPADEFSSFTNPTTVTEKKDIVIVQYTHRSGLQIQDLAKPIYYKDKPLGIVHLGISLSYMQETIKAAQRAVLNAVIVPVICTILMLTSIVCFFSLRLRESVAGTIRAISEYGKDDLREHNKKTDNQEVSGSALTSNNKSGKLMVQDVTQAHIEEYLNFSCLDRILVSPLYKGESYTTRRQVTVLFAGVKEFGSYASTKKPEKVVASLNEYLRIATRIICNQGGYIDKFIGDAVVGIFGVSLYRDNHTARAVRAALELKEALSAKSENNQLLGKVSIGISSGVVLSGNIGFDSKIEYGSIGQSIKEAYWLNCLSNPGDVILGEEIYSQIRDLVEVEALEPRKMIGRSDVIRSFRLISIKDKEEK